MKTLLIVTGRGLGGDATIALNVIRALEKRGVECEIALDESAPGTLFEKNGYSWHKISIPQAGGHAATKLSAVKAAFKSLTAAFKARKLIRKLDVDFVLGVLGGGAVIGSAASKLARKPAFSLISTPLDSKICPKLNKSYILPEIAMFKSDVLPKNIEKSYYPLTENVGDGNGDIAFEKLSKEPKFDSSKKTIVFSSGSSIFKGTIEAANTIASGEEYNVLLVGLPMHDEYLDIIDEKIIYLGYIDWITHLFKFADLAVLTDDGVMLEESLACGIPSIALTRVKWGRYHNMAGVFKGAIIESEVGDIAENLKKAFDNIDSLKENALKYSSDCKNASDYLVDRILKEIK